MHANGEVATCCRLHERRKDWRAVEGPVKRQGSVRAAEDALGNLCISL